MVHQFVPMRQDPKFCARFDCLSPASAGCHSVQEVSGNEANPSSSPQSESQATPDLSAPKIDVDTRVLFLDEFGDLQLGLVMRIVPRGEYSANEISYSVEGFIRVASEIARATPTAIASVNSHAATDQLLEAARKALEVLSESTAFMDVKESLRTAIKAAEKK